MKTNVCVQGLGFVGSAMSVAVAGAINATGERAYQVIGLDLPNDVGTARVKSINRGYFPFEAEDESLVKATREAYEAGNLRASTDPAVLSEAEIVVVDVHLDIPVDPRTAVPDVSSFLGAIRTVGSFAKPDALIIVETTVPPGTCANLVSPVLAAEFVKRGLSEDSFHLAHSYERVMPGPEYLSSITNYWRVYAGHTEEAADRCADFLSTIINVSQYPLVRLSSTKASETAKILENTYRAVNIALIDEWTKFAEKLDVDLHEVVKAIGMRPTHSNIRSPGLGVGGYCLTKDPLFGPAAANLFLDEDMPFPFARLAVETNQNMPLHVVERVKAIARGVKAPARVLLCGVSYRSDVGDTRYSPSELLAKRLLDEGYELVCHDPYVGYWDELDIEVRKTMPKADDIDIVILAVSHRQYGEFNFSDWCSPTTHFLDTSSVLSTASREELIKLGLQVHVVGRGVTD